MRAPVSRSRPSSSAWVVFGSAHPSAINLADLGSGGFEIGGTVAGAETGVLDESHGGPGIGDVNGSGALKFAQIRGVRDSLRDTRS